MIAEGMRRVVDVLFDGVKRSHYVGLIMDEKGTPKGVPGDAIIFGFSSFLKENPNVIAESTQRYNWNTRVTERVKPEKFWPPFSLLAGFDESERHCRL